MGKTETRTVAYCRTSTDEQVQAGTIATQRGEIERYAGREGLSIDEVYADDGVSGTVPIADRPGGRLLMDAVHRGEIETVLLYRLDRLGREDYDVLATSAYLRQRGVRLLSCSESLGDDTPSGRMQLGILAVFACMERGIIRQRTLDGRRRRVREGGWPGGSPPYGYEVVADGSGRRIAPAADMADLVRRLYERCADGHSLRELALWLTSLGLQAPRGGTAWHVSTVQRILANPVNRGEYQNGNEVCPVEPMVSRDLWERVQERLQRNIHQRSLQRENAYTLTGYLSCYHCGSAYVGVRLRPRHDRPAYRYYRCNRFTHAGAIGQRCEGRMVPCDDIEPAIIGSLGKMIADPRAIIREVIEIQMEEAPVDSSQRPMLEGQVAAIESQRQTATGLCVDGLITRAELAAQLGRLEQRRAALEAELAELDAGMTRTERRMAALGRLEAQLWQLRAELAGECAPDPATVRGVLDELGLRVRVETVAHGRKDSRFPLHVDCAPGCMGSDAFADPSGILHINLFRTAPGDVMATR